jgi:hypothetical protein
MPSDQALLSITSVEKNPSDVGLQRAGLVELAELATSNPSFVVIKGWEDLEAALRALVEAAWPGAKRSYPLRRLPDLVSEGYVDASFASAVRDFRGLRNDVAHGQHNPTAGEAVTYVESTRELAQIAMSTAAYLAGQRAAKRHWTRRTCQIMSRTIASALGISAGLPAACRPASAWNARAVWRLSVVVCVRHPARPGVRRAGLPRQSPARTPGQRRRQAPP